jgi:Tol biopolymer transport system component
MPSIAAPRGRRYNPRSSFIFNDAMNPMTDAPADPSAAANRPSHDRLDSWKEIATYMRRDVKTVQRWEKREGMPVHRHVHDRMGSVYAFRLELDEWAQNRRLTQPDAVPTVPETAETPGDSRTRAPRWRWLWGGAAAAGVLAVTVALFWPGESTPNLTTARFQPLTDFPGIEQAVAISRDGRLAAFLSDRDGQMDVWITQIGTGEFYNLTKGAAREIVNPSVRTVDFSPDSTLVTFWARRLDPSQQSEIGVWAVPVLGGAPRPYLDGVAEFDWTDDGGRLVFHTPGPGDPMFVRDASQTANPTPIFSAPAGLHSHFPVWSPDGAFIYFVQGMVPDRMDIWRVRPAGGAPERITSHDSVVTYPAFLNERTLVYAANDPEGSGPWLHTVDVEQRVPRRVIVGVDRFTSLAASGDGRRLVASVSSPKGTLWRLPVGQERVALPDARPIPLTTGNGSSPRFGNGVLLYVSSKGTSDSIWKLEGGRVTELWNASDTRVVGGPSIARDGRRIAFTIRRNDGRTLLSVADIDGTNTRIVATSLELQGAPAWAPDGDTVTVAARVDGVPRLFNVPLDGRQPARVGDEHAVDPVWSASGEMVVFSGADIGTTFPLKAATADGRAHRMPPITLTRGARHVAFVPGQRAILLLRGELQHKNLWLVDLDTGVERQLTSFEPGFDIRDFDISPDGREIVIEQVQEHSDIVLLELPPE